MSKRQQRTQNASRWEVGTHVLLRGIAHGKVWIVQPVTVVEDAPAQLVVSLVPGAPCKIPAGLIARKYSGDDNAGSRWDEQDGGNWQLMDWTWAERRALIILLPDKYYAVYLFWSEETDAFEGWYVNFQRPFSQSATTIDTLDLEIDLVIKPDYSWHWKDEPEYAEGVKRGSIPGDAALQIELSREEVLRAVNNRAYPFDGEWREWRPDPTWMLPTLVDGWDKV